MRTGLVPVLGACAALGMLATAPAGAGDEVDYSAPYLVVEDGKLVTKYPGKEHDPGAAAGVDTAAAADAEPVAGPGAPGTGRGPWFAAVAGIAILAAAFLAWRRRD